MPLCNKASNTNATVNPFSGNADTAWLPFVGEKGWILITKDKRIRFNDLEKEAVVGF